jgi:hypothetical protein
MHTTTVNVTTGEIVQVPYTTEEQAEYDLKKAAWDAGANDRKAAEVRAERNVKLSATDWTQIADATVDKAAWATYRQALRNIPTQSGFPNTIIWPDAP